MVIHAKNNTIDNKDLKFTAVYELGSSGIAKCGFLSVLKIVRH